MPGNWMYGIQASKEEEKMIEVYDIKDAESTEPKKLTITPELVLAAYNILIQYCRQQEIEEEGSCNGCILCENCPGISDLVPMNWQELHYPRLIGNTIEYLKDGKIQKITYNERQEAEKALKEIQA